MQGSRLYVGNLKYSATIEKLEELFSSYGEVLEVDIIGDKGFGFVTMGNNQQAEEAKEALNGTEFLGRALRIDEAHPVRSKDDSISGSGPLSSF